MYKMTDEEFYEVYGRMPHRTKKKKVKIYWSRIIIALIILILLIIGIVKLIKLIAGKVKGGDEDKNSVSSSAVDDTDDYLAEPDNKEADAGYHDVELTVCIDPAHGGFDKGTESEDGRCEKDDTMSIALALKAHLESCGVKVIMTRTDDVFIDVDDRSRIANEQGADILISIHRDSNDIAGSDPHGFEAWIHNSEPSADKTFAENIMSKLEDIGISENKGVRGGYPEDSSVNYLINSRTEMPSVLLNMGYVTSSIDNQLLDANLEAYARAIGNSIIETAMEFKVVDERGVRLRDDFLVSDKIDVVPDAAETQTLAPKENDLPDESSQAEWQQPDDAEWQGSENEWYPQEDTDPDYVEDYTA